MLARRIFKDGRTRAYAWGRAAAREDVAAAAEGLIAMSGQFQQRRLSRPSFQLDVLDTFAENDSLRADARTAWRELLAARRRHDELMAGKVEQAQRLAELRALVEDTQGFEAETESDLREQREKLRHVEELVAGAAAAAEALAPDEGDGAAGFTAVAERAIAPLEQIAPELARAGDDLRDVELRLRETATELRSFLETLGAEPGRLEDLEGELERISDAKRRFRCETYEELLARAAEARSELEALDAGIDPAQAAAEALGAAESRLNAVAEALHMRREHAAPRFADAVAAELAGLGLGEGEFQTLVTAREPGPTGADDVQFLIRPEPGHAARAGRGDRVGRRALAHRARDRGRRGRRHARLRRDRRGHRRRDRERRRPRARARRRAHAGDHDHAPAADRSARRPPLPRREGPGRPDAHAIKHLSEAEKTDELERMLGGRDFLETLKQ